MMKKVFVKGNLSEQTFGERFAVDLQRTRTLDEKLLNLVGSLAIPALMERVVTRSTCIN